MKVLIPTALRKFTEGHSAIQINADTVDEAIKALIDAHPELGAHLVDSDGQLAGFINLFVNDTNIRDIDQGATRLEDHDELLLVPAIAGG